MNEKDSYIYSFLNSKGAALSFYVPKILSENTPKSQLYTYYERVLSLINEVSSLLVALDVRKLSVNVFFNQLLLLKEVHVTEIDALLNKYEYSKILQEEYKDIVDKCDKKEPLQEKEMICLEFYIRNHLISEDVVYEMFIEQCLKRNINISYELFEILFVDYTKYRMKEYIQNPKCFVVDTKKLNGMMAYSCKNRIYLPKEDVMKLYGMGVYVVIKNMLHEVCHIKQYRAIKIDCKCDEFTMKQIKEEILSTYCPRYYEDNYSVISSELEAETFAIAELLKIFEKFSICFKNNQNPYVEPLNKLIQNVNNNQRKTKEGMFDINELFDAVIIHHPELLDLYPQLKRDYEIGYGDLVVRKDDFNRLN